jgi:hypothetical protein
MKTKYKTMNKQEIRILNLERLERIEDMLSKEEPKEVDYSIMNDTDETVSIKSEIPKQ